MIDLLDIGLDIPHRPFGNERIITVKASSHKKIKQLSTKLSLDEGGYQLIVTSIANGTKINIKCSPAKALQGHNVFGTNDVCGLACKIICSVLDRFEITYTPDERESWAAGIFDIAEVHITHRFKLPAGITVENICTHLLRSTNISLRPQWLTTGSGLVLHPPRSSLDWLLYDKELELQDKRVKEARYLKAVVGDQFEHVWAKLLATASRSIRAELKLSKAYLQKHGLNGGAAWTAKKARTVYFAELAKLRLGALDALQLPDESMPLLESQTHQRTLKLWDLGVYLPPLFAASTLDDHRRAILGTTGIDVCHDVPCSTSLRLSEIFCLENVRTDFPNWADSLERGAYRPNYQREIACPPLACSRVSTLVANTTRKLPR